VEVVAHDVLIVGGGVAAMRAATAAAEASPGSSIALVSRSLPAFGPVPGDPGVATALGAGDSPEAHALDSVRGGDFLADQDAVLSFAAAAPAEVVRLDRAGCPWSRDLGGGIALRPAPGMSAARVAVAGEKTGFHVHRTLFLALLGREEIVRYDEVMVTKLVEDDGAVAGAVMVEIRTGRVLAVAARAVVLAAGGPVAALAYRAGVPLKDPEFDRIGGVPTDSRGRAPLKGLFAAGHGSCPSVHGARRLPGNCLAAALVFGGAAGEEAAWTDRVPVNRSLIEAQAADEARRIGGLLRSSGTERAENLGRELGETMEQGCGAARDAAGLEAAAAKLSELRARLGRVRPDDWGPGWNAGLVKALGLDLELDCAAAAVQAALSRQETRGVHVRSDHPARDDLRFLRHTLVHRSASGPRVDFAPVNLAKWRPGESG